jgi:hypothetical protein
MGIITFPSPAPARTTRVRLGVKSDALTAASGQRLGMFLSCRRPLVRAVPEGLELDLDLITGRVASAVEEAMTAISEAARELGMPGYEIAYGYVYVWEEDPGLG